MGDRHTHAVFRAGVNRSNSISTVTGFNVTTNTFVPLASMSVARSNLQLVASNDGDGSLYAIGGQKLIKSGSDTFYVRRLFYLQC